MWGSQIRRLPEKSLNTEIAYIYYICICICMYIYIYLLKYFKTKKNTYHLESCRFLLSCFFLWYVIRRQPFSVDKMKPGGCPLRGPGAGEEQRGFRPEAPAATGLGCATAGRRRNSGGLLERSRAGSWSQKNIDGKMQTNEKWLWLNYIYI